METINDLDEHSAEVENVQLEAESLNYPTHWRKDAGSLSQPSTLSTMPSTPSPGSPPSAYTCSTISQSGFVLFFFFNYLMASENAQNPQLKDMNGTK